MNPSNVRNRLLNGTPDKQLPNGKIKAGTTGIVQRVNERRAAEGRLLLPDRVTPHTLRRTFASLCFFAGRDLRWVMGQLEADRVTPDAWRICSKDGWTLLCESRAPQQETNTQVRSPPARSSSRRAT